MPQGSLRSDPKELIRGAGVHHQQGDGLGRKGTVKDVQGLLRHSRTATTTDVYMQELPEGVAATVNEINRELRKEPKMKLAKLAKRSRSLLPKTAQLEKLSGQFATKCYQIRQFEKCQSL